MQNVSISAVKGNAMAVKHFVKNQHTDVFVGDG